MASENVVFIRSAGLLWIGPLLINPGSVGCPAYEDGAGQAQGSESGSPHARYAVLESSAGGIELTFRLIPYDHEAVARRAEANGRPEWARALRTGFMPEAA